MKSISLILFFVLTILVITSEATKKWLPIVNGYNKNDAINGYAGLMGKAITGLRVSGGKPYRVHIKGGNWLPEVTGNNKNDFDNGYAGTKKGNVIDAVAISGGVDYAVHIKGGQWLPVVNGYDISESSNGYAGIIGKAIDAIMINKRTYATSYNDDNNGGNNDENNDGNNGGDNGNTCYDHSTLAAAAVAYAWGTISEGKSNDGTQLYRAVKDAIFPGDIYYQSCDRGVATAVRWSGADDSFPVGNTGTQDNYLKNSNLWTFIGNYDQSYNELKPGDIVITIPERRGTTHGHIVLYVGNAEIRKKYPNSNAEFVSASLGERSPGCGDNKNAYIGGGYHIYRYNGNYSGNDKNAYTGCASGTS